ncbi:hypothetical protein CPAR01_04787 [Colletotrichum paranaense]|uniref:Uncharacterized protein n=2 Tax=Colletotrichum acutatum species complex TaxID=2707335 RepID=A0AAI9XFH0_9PEZI|nr:uncharacterized protein CPAR01_04787 [Colletotrichum paranaense]KAK1447571.1 hypothetical protein CMEL01_09410 [Colletotrichum melonis]KAK1544154.1 hypothetical protein CPAR01_04787 [Colletotrichum paranaense]
MDAGRAAGFGVASKMPANVNYDADTQRQSNSTKPMHLASALSSLSAHQDCRQEEVKPNLQTCTFPTSGPTSISKLGMESWIPWQLPGVDAPAILGTETHLPPGGSLYSLSTIPGHSR